MQSDCIEIWKDVVGYEGIYQVSNLGRVKSLGRVNSYFNKKLGKVLFRFLKEKPLRILQHNYPFVILRKEDKYKNRTIHSLVLEAFVGKRPEGMESCHNDGDRQNNKLSNLRYDTQSNNNLDKRKHGTDNRGEKHPKAKYTRKIIEEVIALWESGEWTRKEIAVKYGMHKNYVHGVINRTRWRL